MMQAFYSSEMPKVLLKKGGFPLMKWRKLELSDAFVKDWRKRHQDMKAHIVEKAAKKPPSAKMQYPAAIAAVKATMKDRYGAVHRVAIVTPTWKVKKRFGGSPLDRRVQGMSMVRLKSFHPSLCVIIPWTYIEDFDVQTSKYTKPAEAHLFDIGAFVHCR